MRIGIVTLTLHTNYGGILQAYALQTVLEGLGHEVVVFQRESNPRFKLPFWKYPLAYAKRIILRLFVNKNQVVFVERQKVREYPIICQHTNRFIKEHIHTVAYNKLNDIRLSDIDCIIVGSDQIWRPLYVHRVLNADIEDAFLKFAEGWSGKRIAYAASFGVDKWEYTAKQTKECRRLVQLFDAVSVREDSAVRLCSDYLGVNATHVLDPTLLLNKEDYIKLFEQSNIPKNDGELFCYLLDETAEKRSFVEKISNELEMKPYSMSLASSGLNAPLEERIAQPVEKWLRNFYDAEFVVTDSYHGCVFSIIFKKNFIAITNNKRGVSRFISLLSLFNLENHLVDTINDIPSKILVKKTLEVSDDLFNFRNESMTYMTKNLKTIFE